MAIGLHISIDTPLWTEAIIIETNIIIFAVSTSLSTVNSIGSRLAHYSKIMTTVNTY